MTYPITLKVTVDFSSGAGFGTTLVLGDPLYGQLDYNVLGDAASEVVDISTSVTNISTRRGYNLLADQFDPGNATIRIYDPNGDWNPTNTSGPYYGKLVPLRKIQISAIYSGTETALFSGYIIDYGYSYPTTEDIGFVNLKAVDGFRLLNMAQITTVTGGIAGQTTGTRINKILDMVSWPNSQREIDTGDSYVQADPGTLRASLASLKNVEFSEQGAFYMSSEGSAVFHSRSWIQSKSGKNATVFDNIGSGIQYKGISLAHDDKLIINSAAVTRIGGTTQSYTDTDSVAKYLPHNMSQANLVVDTDATAYNIARAYVATRKDTTIRVDSLTLDLSTPSYSAGITAGLGIDYFDTVTINNEAQLGHVTSKTLQVMGVNHDITPRNWYTTFTTSEPIIDAFILNSDIYGVLGTSVLTY